MDTVCAVCNRWPYPQDTHMARHAGPGEWATDTAPQGELLKRGLPEA